MNVVINYVGIIATPSRLDYAVPDCFAGLEAGQTFTADNLGDEYVDLPDNTEADDAEAAEQQQQQQQAAADQGNTKQQQRQQARQETLQRKVDSGQSTLTFMGYDRAVLAQLPEFVQQQVPFLTTAKGAIDLQLLEFLKSLAVSNVSFSNIADRLKWCRSYRLC
jgi:hypothetical protein